MAGIWYRKGTIDVTKDSDAVTGVGTLWLDPKLGPQPGNIIYMPDGKPYEVAYVLSNTSLRLATAYAGASASGAAYAIVTPIVGSIPALANRVAATLAFVEGQYGILDAWANGGATEDVTITNPSTGETKVVPSLAKIVVMTGSDAVSALAALAPAADKLPYFSGPKSAALATLTAFARTLLGDDSASAMRDTLEVGHPTAFARTLLGDDSASAMRDTLEVGHPTAFARTLLGDDSASAMRNTLGLSQFVSLGEFQDFNDVKLFAMSASLPAARIAASGPSPQNKPPNASNWWYTEVYPLAVGGGSVYYRQMAISVETAETFERINMSLNGGATVSTYGPWRKGYNQGGILGTVSQVGGVPTGAIIERGSNANGGYVKFADGTLVCFAKRSFTSNNGGTRMSGTWTFPGQFSSITSVQSTMDLNSIFVVGWPLSSGDIYCSTAEAIGLSAAGFHGHTNYASWNTGYTNVACHLTAIGRWF